MGWDEVWEDREGYGALVFMVGGYGCAADGVSGGFEKFGQDGEAGTTFGRRSADLLRLMVADCIF